MHLFMPPKWHFQLQHILNERIGQLPKTTETTWSDKLHFQMMRSWLKTPELWGFGNTSTSCEAV